MDNAALLYVDETYAINRCIYDVFDSLPRYAEEPLYQEAMEIALADAGIPFEAQKDVSPVFRGHKLVHTYRPDIICYGKIVVELKAVRQLAPENKFILLALLKALQQNPEPSEHLPDEGASED